MASTPSSSGPRAAPSENLTVPNVMFMTRAEAEATLLRAGLRAPSIDDHSLCGSVVEKQIVELGRVCYQHPPAGREQGSRIAVSIRLQTENPWGGELGGGRRWFLMPVLVGQHVDKAKATLKQLGFVKKEVNVTDSDDPSGAKAKNRDAIAALRDEMEKQDRLADYVTAVGNYYTARMQRDEEASSDLGGRAFQNLVEANCRANPDSPRKTDEVKFRSRYQTYDRCTFRYQCPE